MSVWALAVGLLTRAACPATHPDPQGPGLGRACCGHVPSFLRDLFSPPQALRASTGSWWSVSLPRLSAEAACGVQARGGVDGALGTVTA